MKKALLLLALTLFFKNLAFSQDAFITTWQTTEANEYIFIQTTGSGYDYTINWGDGTIDTNQTGNAIHTYVTAGTHTISISGDFPRIYFDNSGSKDKILTIEQWGDIKWTSMERAFSGCSNLNITNTAIDTPNLSSVTNMSLMFSSTSSFNYDIGDWDVSNVTNMSQMFYNASSFNQSLDWDVSNVTDMNSMFFNARTFNGDISTWNVSKVIYMSYMFYNASSFNQPLNWDTSNVTTTSNMFYNASSFNQPLNWDMSNVTNITAMFRGASSFNQPLDWDISKVTGLGSLFYGATMFNGDISTWNVSNVINTQYMFYNAPSFNQSLNWDVSKVTDMSYMFYNASSFNQLLEWDVSMVTDMSFMFSYASSFDQPLEEWDVSMVTTMSYMFYYASSFNQDISDWDVFNVTKMSAMFCNASSFNQPLNWDVSQVTHMSSMFREASSFDQPLDWDVSNITSTSNMFHSAFSFNQPLNWNVSNVTNTSSMFYNASSFNQDISEWDVSNVTNMSAMFYNASSFNQDISNWEVPMVTNMINMFDGVILSSANYDAILKSWSTQSLQTGVSFDAGNSQYCTAETERQYLIDTYGWTIDDEGKGNTPQIDAINNINEEGSYTLPTINGTQLSGDEKYYTETGGTGTIYEIRDKISYDASITYPITLYAYDSGSCDSAEQSFQLTITPKKITITADDITKEYGTTDPTLTYKITSGSIGDTDILTGSLTRIDGENVGDYTISQGSLDNPNYTITFKTANFNITPKEITVSADEINKEYGTTDPTLTYTITSGSLVGTDVLTGSLTRTTGENIGDYNISQGSLDNANYTITFETANFSITPKEITVSADEISKEYRTTDPTLTYTITSGSLVGTDVLTGNLTRVSGEDVGDYTINQGSLGNAKYDITFEAANFSITPIEITVTADDITKEYGTTDPTLTYTITSGSLDGTDILTGSLTRISGENVGDYTISQGSLGNANYDITFETANFSITPKEITVTADDITKEYGTTDPTLTYTITSGSLVGTDMLTGSLTRDSGENVGNYIINQGSLGNPNYTIAFETDNFSITPKEITVSADEITKSQGSVDPELTYTITSGELETGDAFSGSLERETGENIGNYLIEIGTLSLTDNYTITFIEADFIITATASIDDIIISNQIQLYPNPVSSFLNIETNNQLEIKEVYIYNILGSLVKKVNTIEESISLDELSTGSYMMKIITDKGISVKRIIKN